MPDPDRQTVSASEIAALHQRFEAKFIPEPNSGCWLWCAANAGRYEYGKIKINGKMESAHRVAWILFVGSVPDGYSVLHQCDTRPCVNPSHLFLGTQSDNVQDMIDKGRCSQSSKTHCKHGHPYDAENTRWRPSGGRECRACHRVRERERSRKRRSVNA